MPQSLVENLILMTSFFRWSMAGVHELVASWLRHFREEMTPLVQAAQQRQHMRQPKRRGVRQLGY